MPATEFDFTIDPAAPWSIPAVGPLALLLVAVALVALTIWTYRDSKMPRRRLVLILALRLLALIIALLTVLRPSVAVKEADKSPSTLILALDCSKSMTVADELDNKSRWITLQRLMERCKKQLDHLRDEYHVTVQTHYFADDVSDGPMDFPDGPRTDFGIMLRTLAQRYAQERLLRGLVILSDGADNGVRYPALGEAARFRGLNCPIESFGLGKQNTRSADRDIAVISLTADPQPAVVKGKVAIRTLIDAPGFERAKVNVRLFFDDKEMMSQEAVLEKSAGNEVTLETTAPPTPGEVKVTVKVEAKPGEASISNNVLTTYLTVSKEGISVLIIDRLRLELTYLRRALAGDPRFRVFEAIRQTDDPVRGPTAELYNFDRQNYDVIVIGDVSARRLHGGDQSILRKIEDLVRIRGTGLLMYGGEENFAAGGWAGTPIANALPVQLDVSGQAKELVQLLPAPGAQGDFVMRIASSAAASEALWRKLIPSLPGYTRLGRRKDGATTIGQSANGTPLLVRQNYGKGRTAAFALDMTYLWQQFGQSLRPRTTEGIDIHARFWRQLMLYLGQQEETEGSVWIKPDVRRVAAGGKLGFAVGARGKTGLDLPNGTFEVSVKSPVGKLPDALPITHVGDADRGSFWKTETPGEYQITVKGRATDADGSKVEGEATARFIVFQDDTELLRQAADHEFLTRLAQAGGGEYHLADELPKYLEELTSLAAPTAPSKTRYYPDWRTTKFGAFPPILLALFAGLLCAEWALRRWWGLV